MCSLIVITTSILDRLAYLLSVNLHPCIISRPIIASLKPNETNKKPSPSDEELITSFREATFCISDLRCRRLYVVSCLTLCSSCSSRLPGRPRSDVEQSSSSAICTKTYLTTGAGRPFFWVQIGILVLRLCQLFSAAQLSFV